MPENLVVSIRQGANESPSVMAVQGGNEVTLLGIDPALSNVQWTRVQKVSWNEEGHLVSGNLLLPPNFNSQAPPPLVIQISGSTFLLSEFCPDGMVSSSGYAAQAPAAQGFSVLLINITGGQDDWTHAYVVDGKTETGSIVKRVDAAVAMLAEKN